MSEKVRIRRDVESMSAYTPTTSLDVFAQRLGMDVRDLIKLDANEKPLWSLATGPGSAGESAAYERLSRPRIGSLARNAG